MSEPVTVVDRTPDKPLPSRNLPEVVERIGVAKNKDRGFAVMFHRVRVKNSTKFRAWPILGDPVYIEMDPSQWREKYTVIKEYKTKAPGRPT